MPYHLLMKEKYWASSSGDTYGIKYLSSDDILQGPFHGTPFEVDVKEEVYTLSDRMVVRDSKNGMPVAVIVRMILRLQTTFKIYTFTPNADSQVPSRNQKYQGRDLYEFAICQHGWHSLRRTMRTVAGDEYVTDAVGDALDGEIEVTRNGEVCTHMRSHNLGLCTGNQWEITIPPGVDPVLMIAFRAIMDEMNEDL